MCSPPPPPLPNMPFCQQIFLAHSHNIAKWHSGSRGGTGSTKQKTLKNSLTVYEKKILDYFRSINCTTVSIHSCNCRKTGIEVSKCLYLACMSVKIEHTVDGHNHDICNSASLMFMLAQVWGLTQSKTCQIYAFVHRNLFACTENYIKINFVVFSVIFLL